MKKVLYYHIYLTDDYGIWTNIFLEQLKVMEDSGLLSELDSIKITCITQDDNRIKSFTELCSTEIDAEKSPEIELDLVKNPWKDDLEMLQNLEDPKTITENWTFRKIYQDSLKENFLICYIHSKGITSTENFLKRNVLDAQKFKNYYYWRQLLNWGVLKNWEKCVKELVKGKDVAGINYFKYPAKHFSGNFWWAKSSYIRTLPDPATMDWWEKMQKEASDPWLKTVGPRFRDEQWVCSNPKVKVYTVRDIDEDHNPAFKYLPQSYYEENDDHSRE